MQFQAAAGFTFVTGLGVWRFTVADMNGADELNIVTSNLESRSVGILPGQ